MNSPTPTDTLREIREHNRRVLDEMAAQWLQPAEETSGEPQYTVEAIGALPEVQP